MNISEKILSQKLGREVIPGEIIEVDVDLAMSHDGTSPPAIKTFEKISDKVWDNEKIVIVFDHNVPANTIGSAEFQKVARNFIKTQGIKNHYIHGELSLEKSLLVQTHIHVLMVHSEHFPLEWVLPI